MKSLPIAITAFGLELLFGLLSQADVRSDTPGAIRLMMLASLFYLVFAFYVSRYNPPISRASVVAAALLFRLTMAPVMPALSGDVYRYRWEGLVQASGLNPYLVSPDETAHLRDDTYPRIPVPSVRSGYGPVASLVERGGYEVARRLTADPHRQAFWMKLPSVLFELVLLLTLSQALPVSGLIIYAWCPLPVIEFWWNGHNDSLAVFAMMAALLLSRRQFWPAAHAMLGLAIAVKWWPAILWPLLVAKTPRWPRTVWIAPVVLALTTLPYWTHDWPRLLLNARYMSGYVGGWRNNDSLYGLILAATGDQYLAKYAAFALLAATVIWMMAHKWRLEKAWLGALVATLLLSANCHPWYLTWLVPIAAFAPWPPFLIWQLLMPLSYIVLIEWHARGVWAGSRTDRWWIYGPVFTAMAAWQWWAKKKAAAPENDGL